MFLSKSPMIIIGCISSVSLLGMTDSVITPLLYVKGQRVTIIHHQNEYKLVTETPAHEATYYTIEHDTVTPCTDGYLRTIVAVRTGEHTLLGIPLYRHELTITENHTAESHTRTIKTRIVHENGSFALFAIIALGLAGIVYKIAQKVQENYAQSSPSV